MVLKKLKYKWIKVAVKQFDVETSNRILYMQDIHLNKENYKKNLIQSTTKYNHISIKVTQFS